MNKEINILVDSGFNNSYLKYLNTRFKVKNVFTLQDLANAKILDKREIDLIVFTGGADVNPSIYGQQTGKYTSYSDSLDRECQQMYLHFNKHPKLGICRGAQYLTVRSGALLIQHVEGHCSNHEMELHCKDGKIRSFHMTSSHHQMMFPYNINSKNYTILGWSKVYNSNVYLNGNNEQIELPDNFLESEIILYNNTNSLCIQGHPEFPNCKDETVNQTLNLIEDLINGK